ncbi:Calcium and integrin-binding family member 3 [Habropoda laboriosa]|uniref:Calcium and integrin-binding family member 3 n=2 Tax=Habropoda laboriosa TaxID=597456 RepID=A0A0L7RB77_9HYME|nr:Calcium and integrin-binding family member 3 [Habropoda laboriosa]
MGDPGVVPRSMTPQQASTLRIPLSCLTRIPELKENPFRQRISEVFTRCQNPGQQSRPDVSNEGICFEEFLEMMSVFSEQAPRDLKVFYAFKIYDFDEDGVLGSSDLERTCRQLVEGGLNGDEVATVCRKVLEESDIDGDGVLSYLEFEHVVTRASDFMATFHIRI